MAKEPIPFSDAAKAIEPGEYRHFKGGEYTVIGLAHHSEDETQEFVIYKSHETGQMWIRPVAMFLEEVDSDGYKGPRFIKA